MWRHISVSVLALSVAASCTSVGSRPIQTFKKSERVINLTGIFKLTLPHNGWNVRKIAVDPDTTTVTLRGPEEAKITIVRGRSDKGPLAIAYLARAKMESHGYKVTPVVSETNDDSSVLRFSFVGWDREHRFAASHATVLIIGMDGIICTVSGAWPPKNHASFSEDFDSILRNLKTNSWKS